MTIKKISRLLYIVIISLILPFSIFCTSTTCDAKSIFVGIYGGDFSDMLGRTGCINFDNTDKIPSDTDYTQFCNVDSNNLISSVGNNLSGLDGIALVLLERDSNLKSKIFHPGNKDACYNWIKSIWQTGDNLFIAGHSAGGGDVQDIAHKLKDDNIEIQFTVQIDSVEWSLINGDASIPDNVKSAYNYYQNESDFKVRGEDYIYASDSDKTYVENIHIINPIGPAPDDSNGDNYSAHRNIDNDPRVWRNVAGNIISQYYLPKESLVMALQNTEIAPAPVTLGKYCTVKFSLKELNGISKTFERVAIAMATSDHTTDFDFDIINNVTISANQSWPYNSTRDFPSDKPPGIYKIIIRGYDNGSWFDFEPLDGIANHKQFTVIEDVPDVGYCLISDGVTVSPSSVVLGDNFDVSFTLKEIRGISKTFEEIKIEVLRQDNSLLFDFVKFYNQIISANGTLTLTHTNYLYNSHPTGIYKVLVKGKTDGEWFEFNTLGYSVNPKEFSAIDEGGGAPPDLIVRDVYLTEEKRTLFSPGEPFRIYTRIKNIGEGDVLTDSNVRIKYYLSKGKKIDDTPEYIGDDYIEPGKPTAGHSGYADKGTNAPDEPGIYNITVRADADKVVDEEHESNNWYDPPLVFRVNSIPEGYVDKASCDIISGWARDPDTTNSIYVHFYADAPAGSGLYIGAAFADNYREDLPFEDKKHGYTFKLPQNLKDNQIHTIYVYAIDSEGGKNPLLINSPKEIQCVSVQVIMSIINNLILTDSKVCNLNGDLNGDSIVTLSDAVFALKVISNFGNKNLCIESDVNNDKKIGLAEVIYILQKLSEIK